MIDQAKAKRIAEEHIRRNCPPDLKCVILDEQTVEAPAGWIFFFQSATYLETGNLSDRIINNLPIVVDRRNGSISFIKSGQSIKSYIEEYRKRR